MIHIIAYLQVPEHGLHTEIDWQPHVWGQFVGHWHIALAIRIVVFPHVPWVQIDWASNVVYGEE
jgi:hypothetical protein